MPLPGLYALLGKSRGVAYALARAGVFGAVVEVPDYSYAGCTGVEAARVEAYLGRLIPDAEIGAALETAAKRYSKRDPEFDPESVAVAAMRHRDLTWLRYLEARGIRIEPPPETSNLVDLLKLHGG